MTCSGPGLEWGRHIAVEDRRPTCIFHHLSSARPGLPSLGGPLTALCGLAGGRADGVADARAGFDWQSGQVSGGWADWRLKLDFDVETSVTPSSPEHVFLGYLQRRQLVVLLQVTCYPRTGRRV